ncbi:MAG TPA: AraC family transcriptional regulator [Pseudolabrys sp.]|nr:AraC family transcriptional regulator [Pseudolabrys sp.]
MPDCSADKDTVRHFRNERWQDVPKPRSKTSTKVASLGVLPIQGRLEFESTTPTSPPNGGLAGWQKKRVSEFIEKHLSEPISLAQLAALARLSRFHFSRAFKQSFGQPPHRHLLSRRIERAKLLLANFPVTQVALAVGYVETSSFSAMFRRTTGYSPSEFRRRML